MQTAQIKTPAVPVRRYFQIDAKQVDNECRIKAMKHFYFVARGADLDTKDGAGIRIALSVFFGRPIESRADLSGGQWAEATAGVECGLVTW